MASPYGLFPPSRAPAPPSSSPEPEPRTVFEGTISPPSSVFTTLPATLSESGQKLSTAEKPRSTKMKAQGSMGRPKLCGGWARGKGCAVADEKGCPAVHDSLTPAPPPPPPTFEQLRAQILQSGYVESISGGKFHDTHIYVYSARTSQGTKHKPRVLQARSSLLTLASSRFQDDIYPTHAVKFSTHAVKSGVSALPSRCGILEYDYADDSDLEECEEAVETISSSHGIDSAKSTGHSNSIEQITDQCPSDISDISSTLSAASDASSIHIFGYESLPDVTRNDLVDDKKSGANASELEVDHPLPSLTNKAWPSSLPIEDASRILGIPHSAYKTWQALLLYLYNSSLSFAPLRSQKAQASSSPGSVSCSPKSMYRLAEKLGLEDLQKAALAAIKDGLSKENIVRELFCDFTWRYPPVLAMEITVFKQQSSEPAVRAALSEMLKRIVQGNMCHADVVLDSLFQGMADDMILSAMSC